MQYPIIEIVAVNYITIDDNYTGNEIKNIH